MSDLISDSTNDLINRHAAVAAMSEALKRVFPEHRQIAEKCLNALPSAQPERKAGKWIHYNDGFADFFQCSKCNHIRGVQYPFCEKCGARMVVNHVYDDD